MDFQRITAKRSDSQGQITARKTHDAPRSALSNYSFCTAAFVPTDSTGMETSMPLRKSRFEEMPCVSRIPAVRFNSEVWISTRNKVFRMQRACSCLPLVCGVCLRLRHVCPCQCAVLLCELAKRNWRCVSGNAACFWQSGVFPQLPQANSVLSRRRKFSRYS